MIFDVHVCPVEIPGGPQLSSSAQISALMAENDIDRVLLVSKDGDALRDQVEAIDNAFAMLWVDPRERGSIAVARDLIEHPKFRGFKLHPGVDAVPADDPIARPLFELALEHDVPVAVHCGHPPPSLHTLPWVIEKAAIRFPEAKIILTHMGLCVFEYHEGAMDVADRNPNVYVEVSGIPHTWRVKEAVERLGAERVLYGSGAPWFLPRLEIEKVRLSGLPQAQVDQVLGTSAAALLLGHAS